MWLEDTRYKGSSLLVGVVPLPVYIRSFGSGTLYSEIRGPEHLSGGPVWDLTGTSSLPAWPDC